MHRLILAILVSALAAVAAARLSALYEIPRTREVPVARLVANLERDLKADPRNIELQINLARLHGMAYALKTEVVAAAPRAGEREEPYYGLHPDLIPYKTERASTPTAEAAAREHLEKAISHYEAALGLDPRNLLARLGYGWVLDQAGEKTRAIGEYRRVIKEAWVTEETAYRALPETRFFTAEAAGYLIPLLGDESDATEISDLQGKKKALDDRAARAITPIAVPFADDIPPRLIVAADARVVFDADGSGLPRQWTWIRPNAGWLVHDPERKGQITSALQWFGNVTFWLFWTNGYEALAALDDDDSGALTDDELRHLAIWHDRNTNGISEAGEVRPLADHGIVGLSCRYVDGDGVTLAAFSPDGVQLTNGRTRSSYDVLLSRVDMRTLTRR
jgi:tetratricopeptide (TPR) repeat protein